MLSTILLLAQIVQSWPRLDSPLVQPGPTICVGECAGPVVWGPAERGRLVVACDMRSSTCSDGRTITTTRATPVPCEVSPGVWEMVPENTACISWRGLESWAATTTYLSYGAELDNPAWSEVAGGTVEVLPDGYRIRPAPGANNSGITQSDIVTISPGGETRTLACIVRTHRPAYIRYWIGGSQSWSFPSVDTGGRWEVLSATREIPDTSGPSVRIGGGPPSDDPVPFDVIGCWLTRTDTPGRACWDGEAPVTCAADRHTISTEGWPTTEGEIRMVVELTEQLAAERNAWLFDGRGAGNLMGVNPYIQPDGRLRFRIAGTVYGSASPILTWEVGRPYVLRFLRKGGQTYIYRDGALVYSVATPDWAWAPSAHLGMNFSFTEPDVAIAIRALTVRSYEEVSP